ncbi:MAG: protein kinase [Actinomycetota bacterium]
MHYSVKTEAYSSATQVDLDREVAVKVLSTTDEAFVRRFRREAKTLGKLSRNPGIVTVHGTGLTADGQPYLILELCESSVLDHLKTTGRFEIDAACRAAAQVADAVADAHANGVIHRDIKPGNILLSPNGNYLIADFGISTVRGSTLGQTDSIGFTAGYVAPEILKGDEAGTPADIYALGATLFHMVAGEPAFVDRQKYGGNLLALAQRVINDPVPDLRQRGVPDDVCRIIEAAMAKHPTDRPSATQLRDQLRSVAAAGSGGQATAFADPSVADDPTLADPFPTPSGAPFEGAGSDRTMTGGPDGVVVGPPGPGAPVTEADGPWPAPTGPVPGGLLADVTRPADGPVVGLGGSAGGGPTVGHEGGAGGGRPIGQRGPQPNQPPWLLAAVAAAAVALIVVGIAAVLIGRSQGDDVAAGQPESPTTSTIVDEPPDTTEPPVEETTTTEGPELIPLVDVTGETVEAARTRLEGAGFEVEVLARPGEAGIPDVVTGQRPAAGTELASGALISLFIPAEAELVVVPLVTGEAIQPARDRLIAAGLVPVDGADEFDEVVPVGSVIRTVPAGDTEVEIGSEVLVVASQGPAPPSCADVIDTPVASAVPTLEAAGLTVDARTEPNPAVPDGQVFDCAVAGQQVTLVSADGPAGCSLLLGIDRAGVDETAAQKGFTTAVTEVPTGGVTPGEVVGCAMDGTVARLDVAVALPTSCPSSVIGTPTGQARTTLQEVGFTDITVERTASDTVAENAVISCTVVDQKVTLTVSTGPPPPTTGDLTVEVTELEVRDPCVGDGRQPDVYGLLSLTYDGAEKPLWPPRPRADARTPDPDGILTLATGKVWEDVPLAGPLRMVWELRDADLVADGEDGTDDEVSTGTRVITLDGTDRTWRPVSPVDSPCNLRFTVSVTWTGTQN